MLDILIAKETDGEKHLDDLMRSLYKSFYLNKKKGFTDDEFVKEVSRICGSDQSTFFKEYVFSTAPIDYNKFFDMVGLKLVDTNKKTKVKLGIRLKGTTITFVETNSSGHSAGLNVNDEIVAIDGIRITDANFNDVVSMYPEKTVDFLISRDNLIRTIKVKVGMNDDVAYIIERLENTSSTQSKLYNKWMSSVL